MGLNSLSKKMGAFFHSIIEDPVEKKEEEIPEITENTEDAMLVRTINLTKKQEGVVDLFKKHEHAIELYKNTEISKLQAEIERTEFRKKSLLSVLEYEKSQIEEERRDLFADIGVLTYEMSVSGKNNYDFSNHFECIKNLEGKTCEKEEKIIEFVKRYDEEIEILQMSIALQENIHAELHPDEALPVMVICGTCNQTVLEHKFCSHCGTALTEENMENKLATPSVNLEIVVQSKENVELNLPEESTNKKEETASPVLSLGKQDEIKVEKEEKKEEVTVDGTDSQEKPLELFPDEKLNQDKPVLEVENEKENQETSTPPHT